MSERKAMGWSQDDLVEKLSLKGVEISRKSLSAIENGGKKYKNFSIKLLTALAELFDCEIGYLLCEKEYQCKTRCDTDICKETGLNEISIRTLREIQEHDKNENSVTIFPKELFEKLYGKEEASLEDYKQIEEMLLDTSGKYKCPSDNHRPLLMDLLNYILNHYNSMMELLMAFRNLVNPFSVPVFLDEEKRKWFFPDNPFSKVQSPSGNPLYTINLARDEQHPSDNLPLYIDGNFLDSVNMKSIESIFRELRKDYKDNHSSDFKYGQDK